MNSTHIITHGTTFGRWGWDAKYRVIEDIKQPCYDFNPFQKTIEQWLLHIGNKRHITDSDLLDLEAALVVLGVRNA